MLLAGIHKKIRGIMYNLTLGLIEHIEATKDLPKAKFPINFKTVKIYSGEIQDDGIKETIEHPSALVHLRDGATHNSQEGSELDILITTDNVGFDRDDNYSECLIITSDLLHYLDRKSSYEYKEQNYKINQSDPAPMATTILINRRYISMVIKLLVIPLDFRP
jgi:hypothetical protein